MGADVVMRTVSGRPLTNAERDRIISRIEKTVPVKVTRKLLSAITAACKNPRTTPPAKFGPPLETWVRKLLRDALRKADAGKIAEVTENDAPRRDATLRMPRSIVKRLGIVSSIVGRSVSEMLEEKLWSLLPTK